MSWLSWVIVAILVAFMCYDKIKTQKNSATKETTEEAETQKNNNFADSYQRKYLLTRNEWHEYKKLRIYADAAGFQVCPKVRLLDIIEPRAGENYRSLMGKIQSKHVDFLICDQDLHIKAILELDDNSHDQKDRKERDAFMDEILTSVGYKVIRTRSITETTLESIIKQ